jgi:hypothetical protein
MTVLLTCFGMSTIMKVGSPSFEDAASAPARIIVALR